MNEATNLKESLARVVDKLMFQDLTAIWLTPEIQVEIDMTILDQINKAVVASLQNDEYIAGSYAIYMRAFLKFSQQIKTETELLTVYDYFQHRLCTDTLHVGNKLSDLFEVVSHHIKFINEKKL